MKKLLFAITLLCAVQGWAANPSFQSFYTNDFIVVQPLIYARHTNDGGTNVFNNTVIINTNTTITNTGDFITNTNTTIVNNITTNITQNSTIINTNVLISNTFITNYIDNSTIIITNTSITIDGTNVATINPTIGRLPYKSGTNSFDDSALYFIDPSTVGAQEVDAATVGVTNLVAGGIVVSVDSGLGYGYLTNMAFADTLLWTNVGGSGGSYQPTQPQGSLVARGIESYDHLTALGSFITQLSAFELLIVGENDTDVSGASYFAVVGPSNDPTQGWLRINSGNGIGQHLFIVNSADNSAFHMLNGDPTWDNPGLYLALSGGDWISTNKGDTIQLLGTFSGWSEVGRFWANTNIVGDTLWVYDSNHLQPADLTKQLFWTNSVVWGPGATNSLLREGRSLVWTNSDTTSQPFGFMARDGSGAEAQFTVSGNTARVSPGSSGNAVDLYDRTAYLRWGNNRLFPLSSGITLGGINTSVNTAWQDIEFDGTLYGYGLHDTTGTNYSRLAITHTGTNGNVVFASQGAGTAGTGKNFLFTNDLASTRLSIENNSSAILNLGLSSGGHGIILSGTGGDLYFGINNNGAGNYSMVGNAFQPVVRNLNTLGGDGQEWKDLWLSGSNIIEGFRTSSADYSRLAVTHTGTNGAIVFDSQSAGTAGAPRPFAFTNAILSSTYGLTLDPAIYSTNILRPGLASGTNDIYTMPAGFRGRLQGNAVFNSAAADTVYTLLKRSGVYYQLNSPQATTTNGISNPFSNSAFVFEPGDVIAVANSQVLYFAQSVQLFPDYIPLKSACVFGLSASTNLLYTCPAGKAATIMLNYSNSALVSPALAYLNASGSSRFVQRFVVPSGDTLGDTHRLFSTASVSNGNSSSVTLPSMNAGDAVYVSTDSAAGSQWAYVTVYEQ